jgi:DNA repair photolyase
VSAFLGPLLPGLSDTDEALDSLLSAVAPLPLSHIYADKLNRRPGVWNSLVPFLNRYHPVLLDLYRRLFFDELEYRAYCEDLGRRLGNILLDKGVSHKAKGLGGTRGG